MVVKPLDFVVRLPSARRPHVGPPAAPRFGYAEMLSNALVSELESRRGPRPVSTSLGLVPVRRLTAARVEDHLHDLEKAGAAPASVEPRARQTADGVSQGQRRRDSGSERTRSS